jgi:hypothetical protein
LLLLPRFVALSSSPFPHLLKETAMAVTYATVIYPSLNASGGKSLKSISDITGDFMKALNAYLDHEKILEKQGILLPGMNKASAMITKAKKDAGTNDLTVRGGVDGSGNLVISVTGLLPGKKGSEKYEKSETVRPGLKKLLDEMKNEANAVVNMTRISKEEADEQLDVLYKKYKTKAAVQNSSEFKELLKKFKGDPTINQASERQAKRYDTTNQKLDEADFGGITTGTVVLCAHGGAAPVSGTVIGTALGKKSPEELVHLLTGNPDKSKNLSKKFSGIVHLSGCFTASGSGEVPEGYDYSTVAGKVQQLLLAQGYKGFSVRGHPGPAKTRGDGSKAARHAMMTPKGIEALQQKLDAIYKAYEDLGKSHGNDPMAVMKDPRFNQLTEQWKRFKEQQDEIIALDTKTKQRAHDIEGLVGNFGLRGR